MYPSDEKKTQRYKYTNMSPPFVHAVSENTQHHHSCRHVDRQRWLMKSTPPGGARIRRDVPICVRFEAARTHACTHAHTPFIFLLPASPLELWPLKVSVSEIRVKTVTSHRWRKNLTSKTASLRNALIRYVAFFGFAYCARIFSFLQRHSSECWSAPLSFSRKPSVSEKKKQKPLVLDTGVSGIQRFPIKQSKSS